MEDAAICVYSHQTLKVTRASVLLVYFCKRIRKHAQKVCMKHSKIYNKLHFTKKSLMSGIDILSQNIFACKIKKKNALFRLGLKLPVLEPWNWSDKLNKTRLGIYLIT